MVMAQDLYELVTKHVSVRKTIHAVGDDIGGITAHALVAQYPDSVARVILGEWPLPELRRPQEYGFVVSLHVDERTSSPVSPCLCNVDFKAFITNCLISNS